MIIWGTRMYGKKDMVKGWGLCGNCGKFSANKSYSARQWGHLYFIPLIPNGPHTRVVKECVKCRHGMHIESAKVPDMLSDMHRSIDQVLAAIGAGKQTFQENGEGPIRNCADFLAGTIEYLFCLNAVDAVERIFTRLKDGNHTYELHLVTASSLEFKGDFDEAAMAYRNAAQMKPDEAVPLLLLGMMWVNRKEYDNAEVVLQRASELDRGNLQILQSLIDVYEARKDWARLAETYDRAFGIDKRALSNEKIYKAYKKACKKAGRETAFEQARPEPSLQY